MSDVIINMKAHRFPGMDKDVWLPDDIEVVYRPIPASMIGWVRSGVKSTRQNKTLFHETGNRKRGANALAEANYLLGGPEDEDGNRRQVGYNFAVDDVRIVFLCPLNEVTWHAGRAEWNATSWGIEQCVGLDVNLAKARRNAAALHAGLLQAIGTTPAKAMWQHWVVYQKNCPAIIRANSLWDEIEGMAAEASALAYAAAAGGGVVKPGEPTLAKPSAIKELQYTGDPPSWAVVNQSDGTKLTYFYVGDMVQATKTTKRYQYANRDGAVVGPDITTKDAPFRVEWATQLPNGERWFITPFWTRIFMDDTKRVSDTYTIPEGVETD
jgi:N-acetylmuramoyl-L-alanine amidase CwlA